MTILNPSITKSRLNWSMVLSLIYISIRECITKKGVVLSTKYNKYSREYLLYCFYYRFLKEPIIKTYSLLVKVLNVPLLKACNPTTYPHHPAAQCYFLASSLVFGYKGVLS